MIPISSLYGNDMQLYEKLINNIGFGIHVALPCIVQSYNHESQTVEVQPAIRERVIQPDGSISFVEYPLLINVPVAFPQAGLNIIIFPIVKGDECIVLFSDLSIDNWWLSGNVQNPVEQRRHDLSDGMAIFGLKNQKAMAKKSEDPVEPFFEPPEGTFFVGNRFHGAGVLIDETNVKLQAWVSRTIQTPEGEKTVTTLEGINVSLIIKSIFP